MVWAWPGDRRPGKVQGRWLLCSRRRGSAVQGPDSPEQGAAEPSAVAAERAAGPAGTLAPGRAAAAARVTVAAREAAAAPVRERPAAAGAWEAAPDLAEAPALTLQPPPTPQPLLTPQSPVPTPQSPVPTPQSASADAAAPDGAVAVTTPWPAANAIIAAVKAAMPDFPDAPLLDQGPRRGAPTARPTTPPPSPRRSPPARRQGAGTSTFPGHLRQRRDPPAGQHRPSLREGGDDPVQRRRQQVPDRAHPLRGHRADEPLADDLRLPAEEHRHHRPGHPGRLRPPPPGTSAAAGRRWRPGPTWQAGRAAHREPVAHQLRAAVPVHQRLHPGHHPARGPVLAVPPGAVELRHVRRGQPPPTRATATTTGSIPSRATTWWSRTARSRRGTTPWRSSRAATPTAGGSTCPRRTWSSCTRAWPAQLGMITIGSELTGGIRNVYAYDIGRSRRSGEVHPGAEGQLPARRLPTDIHLDTISATNGVSASVMFARHELHGPDRPLHAPLRQDHPRTA